MITRILFLFLPVTLALILFQCQKRFDQRSPIARAGGDAVIFLPEDSAILDGRLSNDPDGDVKEFLWSKISGPVSFRISSPNSAKTSVKELEVGTYQFELKVIDVGGLAGRDTVMVTVNPVNNHNAPVANAGSDQEIILPANTVSLDGSASADLDNNIIRYYWANVTGPSSPNISNALAAQTQVTSLIEGVYQFELIVTDSDGLTGRDTIEVRVHPATATCDGRPYINATLVPVGTLSVGRAWLRCASAGNKILFIGGWTPTLTSTVDIYDLSTNKWSNTQLVNDIDWRDGFAVASLGNKIFIAGGGDPVGDFASSIVNIYDATTNSWSTSHLSVARQGLAASTVGSKVFFAGGGYADYTSWVHSKVVDVYDNATDTWSIDSLSQGRSSLSAVTNGSKIYFAGGLVGSGQPVRTIDIFDAATNSWSVSALQEPKASMAAIAVEDKIFWASGYAGNGGYFNQAEIRDLVTGRSSLTCISNVYSNAGMKNDNVVFGLSGISSTAGTSSFEIYNVTSGTWSVGVLNQYITGAAMISVNNKIYVAGGTEDSKYFDKVWELKF